MKKNFTYLWMAALVLAAAVACNKEMQEEQGKTKVCKLTATLEGATDPVTASKTVIQNGTKVFWTKADRIQVYGVNSENDVKRFQFTAADGAASATREFTCANWEDAYTPIWATSLDSYNNTDGCTVAGVIGTNINPAQNISNAGSYGTASSALVGKVEPSGADYAIAEMKNVPAVLKFTLSTPDIRQIVVSAPGGEKVAGKVNVDYAKLVAGDADFFTVTSGADEITAAPSGSRKDEKGCFVLTDDAPTDYCVCVLPQTYSKGLQFVLTDKDGKVATRTVGSGSGLTLTRSQIKTFSSAIDAGVTFTDAGETHEDIVLGFKTTSPNPFTGIGSTSSACEEDDEFTQTVDGTTYTYVSVGNAQAYWSGGIMMKTNNGFLQLPYIEGYKLSSVTLAGGNSAGGRAAIFKGSNTTDATSVGNNCWIATSDQGTATGNQRENSKKENTWTLTDNYESGKYYYIKATSASFKFIKMVLTYTYVGTSPN